MRLVSAELLKMRRRTATWVVLAVLLVLMLLLYGLAATDRELLRMMARFPDAWRAIADFPFGGLGSMLAVAYAAAIAGADWNWGVLRNIIARGESRVLYVLAKAVALAIVLAIAVLIAFAVGLGVTLLIGGLAGIAVGNPFSGPSLTELAEQLALGYPVLLERAALGFAVAVILRSQLAGVIVGIIFFVGETVVRTTLILATIPASFGGFFGEATDRPPAQWFQYLPFGIGDEVRAAGLDGLDPLQSGDWTSFFLTHVPLVEALLALLLYVAVALAVSVYRAWREEIVA